MLITALAYGYARKNVHNPRFTFGTGKLGDLVGFASAVVLALVALLIGWESVERLANPVPIGFTQAIAVAVVGLVVNLLSAWLLSPWPPAIRRTARPTGPCWPISMSCRTSRWRRTGFRAELECPAFVPIVQWIERIPPKNQIQVRFLVGTPDARPASSQTVRAFSFFRCRVFSPCCAGCRSGPWPSARRSGRAGSGVWSGRRR